MAVSLHTVVVGAYKQFLPQAARLIDKAEAYCNETGTKPDDLAKTCLAPDMWPFSKQFQQIAHHSMGAIEAVRAGSFSPQPGEFPHEFAAMHKEIADAQAAIDAIRPDELDSLANNEVLFKVGKFEMLFDASEFLLSFSLPNFYFHVTTAYNILRMSGIQVGKTDYLGKMRTKG
ncbi:MAG: DUF1993 domain-containing protein [Novosphingobium sp.]|nr:DUF1993 domain-containing protein [Novosphingobium sp.]